MEAIGNLVCPGCGELWTPEMTECPSCHRPVIISLSSDLDELSPIFATKYIRLYTRLLSSNPNDSSLNKAMAICNLKLKTYERALAFSEKAIDDDFNDADAYFLASISLLGGKKAFVAQRSAIDKAMEYINAALEIEQRGIFYLFLAYIKFDFFSRKFLKTTPDYKETFASAETFGFTAREASVLFSLMGVERPIQLN